MNTRKCFITIGLVTFALSSLVGNVKAKESANSVNTGTVYSACSNPGLFSENEIDQAKYKAIYLGYCTERGNESSVIYPVKKEKKHNKKNPVIVVIVDGSSPNPTSTPETPVDKDKPKKVCKNKNQYKENTPDCNAGGGND